uniref:Uncharacterized protein n=1 Tax=Anguilla anguilla TaxID=7936 RepID=A0A0E9SLN2_ANGAN
MDMHRYAQDPDKTLQDCEQSGLKGLTVFFVWGEETRRNAEQTRLVPRLTAGHHCAPKWVNSVK